MGQYLVVFPEAGLVVVRQNRAFAADEMPDAEPRTGFDGIVPLARALLR